MQPVSIERIPINRTLYDFPQVVIIETIAGCNLKCIMCPEKDLSRPQGKMKFPLFKKIIDEISVENPDAEVWMPIMGEVFMMKERVFDLIEYAKSKGLTKIFMNSNFVLFEKSWIDRLDSSGLNKLTVGLDAATKETYEKIRVDGDFDKVEENIKALIEAKTKGKLKNLEVTLQFIVMEENENEEELFKTKWMDKGFTIKVRHRLGWGTAVESPALCLPNEGREIPCPWLMRTMSIHQDGHVAQCDAVWDGQFYEGDLNTTTIKEIWLGSLLAKRNRHLNNDFDMDPCRDCKDWQCGLSETYKD
ncbi:MAG: radical SAM protein [Bacteroidota bacterium]